MSADNKALVRRLFEFVNENRRLPLELYATSYIYHLPSSSEVMDLARVKEVDAMFHAAFPDLHFTLVDMVAEGDKVAYRYTVCGTHMGDFMGIAATGKQSSLPVHLPPASLMVSFRKTGKTSICLRSCSSLV